MQEDQRCCGSGTCLINSEGYCWCGQKWVDGKLCGPDHLADAPVTSTDSIDNASKQP